MPAAEPREGTNAAKVLALIRHHSRGVSDSAIREATGISPHQQVNQIGHQLAATGFIERRSQPAGQSSMSGLAESGDLSARGRAQDASLPITSRHRGVTASRSGCGVHRTRAVRDGTNPVRGVLLVRQDTKRRSTRRPHHPSRHSRPRSQLV